LEGKKNFACRVVEVHRTRGKLTDGGVSGVIVIQETVVFSKQALEILQVVEEVSWPFPVYLVGTRDERERETRPCVAPG
jgi:hypothetical protein